MPGRNQTLMRTRCPACSTVFRVTSDQLRAKAGKVRCGYCQAVFNAFDELIDETQAVATQPLVEPPVSLGAAPHEYLQDEQTEAVGTVAADDEVLITEPATDESEAAVTPEVEPEIESDDADEPDQGQSSEEVPEPLDSEVAERLRLMVQDADRRLGGVAPA